MTVSLDNSEQIRRAAEIFAHEHAPLFAFHGNQWWALNLFQRTWSREGAYRLLHSSVSALGEFLRPAQEFPWVLQRLEQPWTVRQIVARSSHLLTVPGLPGPGWSRATPTEYPSQD